MNGGRERSWKIVERARHAVPLLVLMAFFLPGPADAQVRIKDIVSVENATEGSLIGYGLVVGLSGTGDRSGGSRGALFTVQSIANMLERFGITVPREQLRTRNVAAVMVTGRIPAFGRVGSRLDITVSSLGDAKSLEGGVLLMTPLMDAAGTQYALGQGPVSIGGFNIETRAGEQLRRNHALVGRVPGGASLIAEPPGANLAPGEPVRLHLVEPDFMTARRIADRINAMAGAASGDSAAVASPLSPAVVEVTFPASVTSEGQAVAFMADLEVLEVQPDTDARVIINERTGTIVAGGAVTVGEVMISHGSLTIHTRRSPVISQPPAFSSGQTVVDEVTDTQATEDAARIAVVGETATVSDLATALNDLGLKPREMIAIFQAIKEAGALRAELIIL